nr:thioesterase ITB [uncultured archaeon]UMA73083.1 thioesterase ITB [uncultured archaeon]
MSLGGSMALYSKSYRVYWSETDAALMMHFSNFFRVCERTEEEFLRSLGFEQHGTGSQAIGSSCQGFAECDYRSPLRPGDMYRVDIVDIVMGSSSLRWHYEIYNETRGELSATCEIVTVAYDESLGKSVPIPDEIREKLMKAGARPREALVSGS